MLPGKKLFRDLMETDKCSLNGKQTQDGKGENKKMVR